MFVEVQIFEKRIICSSFPKMFADDLGRLLLRAVEACPLLKCVGYGQVGLREGVFWIICHEISGKRMFLCNKTTWLFIIFSDQVLDDPVNFAF